MLDETQGILQRRIEDVREATGDYAEACAYQSVSLCGDGCCSTDNYKERSLAGDRLEIALARFALAVKTASVPDAENVISVLEGNLADIGG